MKKTINNFSKDYAFSQLFILKHVKSIENLILCPQGGILPKPQGPGASVKFPFQ